MKKRSDKNSATSAVAGFAGVIDDAILPPAGVELRINFKLNRDAALTEWHSLIAS